MPDKHRSILDWTEEEIQEVRDSIKRARALDSARPPCSVCRGTGNRKKEWYEHYGIPIPCRACNGTGKQNAGLEPARKDG